VQASNAAGTGTRISRAVAIFKGGKARLNRRRGIAKLTVQVPSEAGVLTLAGRGFRPVSRPAAGRVVIPVRPKGKKRKRLAARGKLRAVVRLAYAPPDGPPATLRARVTLKRRLAHVTKRR
jgi:hypothetical protein